MMRVAAPANTVRIPFNREINALNAGLWWEVTAWPVNLATS